jgi:hypothetical protein
MCVFTPQNQLHKQKLNLIALFFLVLQQHTALLLFYAYQLVFQPEI